VFDGLLKEPYNGQILELLFVLAHWHGFAKLRLHTDDTLEILDGNTILLGAKFRDFQDITCASFKTKELQREADARMRRAARTKSSNSKGKAQNHTSARSVPPPVQGCDPPLPTISHPGPHVEPQNSSSQPGEHGHGATGLCARTVMRHERSGDARPDSPTITYDESQSSARFRPSQGSVTQVPSDRKGVKREAKFSLHTYKHHSLGDYVETIRRYGTTDSYSTEPVRPCLAFIPTFADSLTRANSNIALPKQDTNVQAAKPSFFR